MPTERAAKVRLNTVSDSSIRNKRRWRLQGVYRTFLRTDSVRPFLSRPESGLADVWCDPERKLQEFWTDRR